MASTVRERNRSAIEHLTYQSITASQQLKVDAMRKSAQQFAKVVIKNTEAGPEATLAQRHIEDALNRAIRSVIFEQSLVDEIGDGVAAGLTSKRAATKKVAPVKKAPGRGVKRSAA